MRFGLCCCCCLMISSAAQAKGIDAVVSHTLFYLQESGNMHAYIETYWQINPKTVYYVKPDLTTVTNPEFTASIKTDIIFRDDTGIVNQAHFILQTRPAASAAEALTQNIIELHRYLLPPGKIKMQLILTDTLNPTSRFNYLDSFIIPPHDGAFCSGIEILDTVVASQEQSMFLKNDLQLIPLCSNFLDDSRDKLQYYFELYHSNLIPEDQYPLIEQVYIAKKETDPPFPKFFKRDTIRAGEILPILGKFDISKLSSGNYFLSASLVDNRNVKIASSTLFFQRLNNKKIAPDTLSQALADSVMENVTVLNLNKTFLAKYTLPQIRAILKMLLPVSDPTETRNINGFLKNPEELYMRYYIFNYFSNINRDDPEKAWVDFSNVVREVNKLYGSSSGPGYETDMGAIYMKYGKPSEQFTVENESGTYPYEIWQYNALKANNKTINNAVFLFYRPSDMVTGFRLLHSNVPDEVRNKAWRSILYLNGGSGNSYSQAEQYIGNK